MKQQRGGTFIGFIVGVVVGLGAALAVAVYVTKVPVPFTNKSQSRSVEQDEAEAKKNKDWDPNAPLYGKNPAKAVPSTTTSSAAAAAAAAAPAATMSAAAGKTGSRVEDKAAGKSDASADPLGDLVKAKTGGAQEEPFTYFVQLGAFRTAEDAEALRAKLSLSGIETKLSEREQSGRTVYRVRVGPFSSKEEAEQNKDKLDKAGMTTTLVRVQRQ